MQQYPITPAEISDLMALAMLGIYVYSCFVWMTIAKKLKYNKPWLAWIPIVNFFLIPILAQRKWPWGFIVLVPIAGIVFYSIWTWRIYTLRKYPGALCLIPLAGIVPFLGWPACIANLLILGLVAWKDKKNPDPK